jgi:NAD(P)-dependent dehydrogenase (short-subunit alcohol dehydrogenase family)
MDELSGTTAVVTGAASGIGYGIASVLAGRGVNVVLADIEEPAGEQAADRISAAGGTAVFVPTDVADLDAVRALAAIARDRFGSVEILCNNAGVSYPCRGVDATHEDWQWIVGVNLWGVVHGVEVFLPEMVASGRPAHIVNTASMNGLFPSAYSPMYSATKYAVVGLTETLRNELVDTQVGVSVLCPAGVVTRIMQSERNRPAALARPVPLPPHTPSSTFDLSPALQPEQAGELVVQAILDDRLYVFTDPKVRPYVDEHYQRMLADFAPVEPASRLG